MYNKTVLDYLMDTKDNALELGKERFYEILGSVVFLVLIQLGKRAWLDFIHVAMFLEIPFAFVFPENMFSVWVISMFLCTFFLYFFEAILARFSNILKFWFFGPVLFSAHPFRPSFDMKSCPKSAKLGVIKRC